MTMFDKDISRGTRILQAVGGFVVLAIFAGVITFLAIGWSNASSDARETRSDLISEVNKNDKLQEEYNGLYKEYRDATGKTPTAPTPEQVKTIPGATGDRGPKGDMGIQGQTGPIGATGATGATGANGKDGVNGTNGKDGSQGPKGDKGDKGDPGTPGADSTVPGPVGATGPAGANGVGIQSIQCQGDGADSMWVFGLSDGSVATVAGPCRLTPLP